MSDLQMWALVVGFVLPPVLAVIQQPTWSNKVRSAVSFAACAAAGAGTAYFQGDLTGKRFVSAGLVVFVTAIATYRNWWKTTGVAGAIEEATSPTAKG